jgi:hypothetical protein
LAAAKTALAIATSGGLTDADRDRLDSLREQLVKEGVRGDTLRKEMRAATQEIRRRNASQDSIEAARMRVLSAEGALIMTADHDRQMRNRLAGVSR